MLTQKERDDLLAGKWHVNIHTQNDITGEITGAIEEKFTGLPAPCCLPDDTCGAAMFPSDCRDLGGRIVTSCGGDSNGNGVGDNDGNGTADACECAPAPVPLPDLILGKGGVLVENVKSRALSFSVDGPPRLTAVEVTFVDLPAPFDVLNGTTAWVGPPQARSENGASATPIPGFSNYQNASLQCDPHYEHWSRLNMVHVTHEWIVPGGVYELRTVGPLCDPASPSGSLTVRTGRWADSVGPFDLENATWLAADGSVDVATDVVAALDKFGSAPGSPTKVRVDIDYDAPDGKINITDVTVVLDAFAGGTYPYEFAEAPCP